MSVDSELTQHKSLQPLGVWQRLVYLYSSPQVKFYLNIVSYFAFLVLFAVVLMIDFQDTPSPGEMLLYIWLLSLVFEEIRQVGVCSRAVPNKHALYFIVRNSCNHLLFSSQLFHDPDGFGFKKKARMYIKDLWNMLDVLSIILFIIGLAFR